jgi:hypothetical protein
MEMCVYCDREPGTTRDHVPPRCFFPTPMPPINRITVPCCETCRVSGGKNDGLVRSILISTIEAEPHEVVQSQLAEKRNRSWQTDPTQLRGMVRTMVRVSVKTPHGLPLGSWPAFNLDNTTMNDFFDRVARALVHAERKAGYVASA